MAKTKIKLRPDQAAIVFNADGSTEAHFHDQPEDIAPMPANLACAFAAFAVASTPADVQMALIASMDEDGDPLELGIEELGDVQIGPAEMAGLRRELDGIFAGAADVFTDEAGASADAIDVEFEDEDND